MRGQVYRHLAVGVALSLVCGGMIAPAAAQDADMLNRAARAKVEQVSRDNAARKAEWARETERVAGDNRLRQSEAARQQEAHRAAVARWQAEKDGQPERMRQERLAAAQHNSLAAKQQRMADRAAARRCSRNPSPGVNCPAMSPPPEPPVR